MSLSAVMWSCYCPLIRWGTAWLFGGDWWGGLNTPMIAMQILQEFEA